VSLTGGPALEVDGKFRDGLFVGSLRVERLADIVTSIAEDTVFLVEGRLVRHGAE
jgi:hypothetical protein